MVDIQYLMKRYDVTSKPGMIKFIRNHIDDINLDGEHAAIKANSWKFDEIAVERIDKIRGYGLVGVVDERVESAKIVEANKEICRLRELLEAAFRERAEHQNQIIGLKDEIIELSKKAGSTDLLNQQIVDLKSENQQIVAKNAELNAAAAAAKARLDSADERIEDKDTEICRLNQRIRELEKANRPFWQRWFFD